MNWVKGTKAIVTNGLGMRVKSWMDLCDLLMMLNFSSCMGLTLTESGVVWEVALDARQYTTAFFSSNSGMKNSRLFY